MSYIGKSPSGSGVRTRYYFTQTSGGGTSISGTDDNGKTLTYTDGEYMDVYLNGVLLVHGTDYGTGTANTISSLAALANGDVVEVVVYDIFNVAKINNEAVRKRYYKTASGSETSISGADDSGATITFPANAEIEVKLNGVALVQGTDYNTTTANTVGGLSALSAGQVVEVVVYERFVLGDTVSKADGGTFAGNVGFSGDVTIVDKIIHSGDTDTAIRFPAADNISFETGGGEKMVIDNTGVIINDDSADLDFRVEGNNSAHLIFADGGNDKVGFGASVPTQRVSIEGTANDQSSELKVTATAVASGYIGPNSNGLNIGTDTAGLVFKTGVTGGSSVGNTGTERMRIDSGGSLTIPGGDTSPQDNSSGNGLCLTANGEIRAAVGSSQVADFNRMGSDGTVILIRGQGIAEGSIEVNGSTVSLNGGHLSRWSQTTNGQRISGLLRGTVMTNLDQMAVWSHDEVLWTEDDELPDGVSVGDVRKAAYTENNEQLNCMAVSSVEGDANVAGVFQSWDEGDDFNDMTVAMTGDFIIRIASGTTVARGDLLMSAGDGTAKPQGDDIVRSKTIAKVISTNVSHTYDDGSYLVPCVLMAC